MKKHFILIILVVFSGFSIAQTAGNSGLSFLKLGFGARNIAMGDLGVSGANDVTALFYNPANLSKFESAQVLLTHNELIQDLRSELIGASFTIANIPFAVGVNTTSVSDIEVRTKPGDPVSTFNANYFYGSLSTGFSVYKNISVGASVKYIYEGMFSDEATGYGIDFGAAYDNIIQDLNFGISIRNIGSMHVLRTEATELPVDFRAGFSYDYDIPNWNFDLKTVAGIQKYSATEDIHIHGGLEFTDNTFALRLGYATGYESKGISAGVGVKWKFMNFDYAFAPYSYDLGNAHIISVMFSM